MLKQSQNILSSPFFNLICFLTLLAIFANCKTTAGLSGPVYRTDADLILKKIRAKENDEDTTFILQSGLKYRIVDTDKGTHYIKMIPIVGYYPDSITKEKEVYIILPPDTKDKDKDKDKDNTSLLAIREIPPNELYSVAEANLNTYNKVIVQNVSLGTMLLPIKMRRSINFNGIKYNRQFSTDISIGPYIGYRFKFKGNNYKTHTTLGLFAGPTLIDYVSTTNQSGSPSNGVNPDNMFAFTSGIGLVHEINGFQIGFVYGADWVSGKRVEDWPYDGKSWFSLGIGYNFLSGRQ